MTTSGGFISTAASVSRMNRTGFSLSKISLFSSRNDDPGSGHAVSAFAVTRVPSASHATYRSPAKLNRGARRAQTAIAKQIRRIPQSSLPATFSATHLSDS
jgi:hypothetical protein